MPALSDSELKDLAQAQATGGPQPGQLYRHFRTRGLYLIVARSLMEDTHEPLVTYRSNDKGTYWTRTVANFEERINNLGPFGGMRRFTRVEA